MQAAGTLRRLVDARTAREPSWILLIELFIGLGWIRAAVSKAIEPDWWNGDVIRDFVASMAGEGLVWWEPVLDTVVLRAPVAVAVAVFLGQLVAGMSLLAGRWLGLGLTVGMTLNLTFVLSGAVEPSVFYLISQAVIALWLYENHRDPQVGRRSLRGFMYAAAVVVMVSVPFVGTLDPVRVIDDPAAVLTTYAVAIGVSTWVAQARLAGGRDGLLADQVERRHVASDRL